jgi:hypothetical protein
MSMPNQTSAPVAPLYVLINRAGSGTVIHRGRLHGVSSVRTFCGRLRLRYDVAGILDHAPDVHRSAPRVRSSSNERAGSRMSAGCGHLHRGPC